MKDQIIQSNPIKTPKTNQTPINLVFKHSRQGRQKIRTTNKTRNGSLPHRGIKIRIERIRAMPERNNKNEWIEPFIGESRKTPIIKLEVDKKNIEGSIRVRLSNGGNVKINFIIKQNKLRNTTIKL